MAIARPTHPGAAASAKRPLNRTLVGFVGFMLSPLSWWNDAFVNLPIAYVLALPFSLIGEGWFLPALVAGYWLTNVAGLLLLHWSLTGAGTPGIRRSQWVRSVLAALAYTGIIAALALAGVLKPPWMHR
jgi:hypothetical protein